MTDGALLALTMALLLAAAMAAAFFRLRRRHRCCRHALNSARSERDKLRLRVASLEAGRANG